MEDIEILSLMHRLNMVQASLGVALLAAARHIPAAGVENFMQMFKEVEKENKAFEDALDEQLAKLEGKIKNG